LLYTNEFIYALGAADERSAANTENPQTSLQHLLTSIQT
jgi:hypothetical protein